MCTLKKKSISSCSIFIFISIIFFTGIIFSNIPYTAAQFPGTSLLNIGLLGGTTGFGGLSGFGYPYGGSLGGGQYGIVPGGFAGSSYPYVSTGVFPPGGLFGQGVFSPGGFGIGGLAGGFYPYGGSTGGFFPTGVYGQSVFSPGGFGIGSLAGGFYPYGGITGIYSPFGVYGQGIFSPGGFLSPLLPSQYGIYPGGFIPGGYIPALPPSPVIDSFTPIKGYPGSIVEIAGRNFSKNRAQNQVIVGGVPAYIVEASETRLKVIAGTHTVSGPVRVNVGGRVGTAPVNFEALDYPDPRIETDGPPLLYLGAGPGVDADAPAKGTLRVIVVLCQASDNTPPNPATVRNDIIDAFNQVHTFYDQASYGELDVQTDVTANWRTLDGQFSDFMDTNKNNLYVSKLDQIIAEAAQQAVDEGFNLNDYHLIAAMVYTNQFIRCWGGGSYTNFQYHNPGSGININIAINQPISAIWINETANWGRCAHEVGHCIVSIPGNLWAWEQAMIMKEDVYRSDLVNPDAATAALFDMMGSHDRHPLFSAYYMEQMEYYNASNILELDWDRNPFSTSYLVVAHGETQDAIANRYHIIKIRVSEGLYYYIEVRQRPDPADPAPQVFDENLPLNGAAYDGGVVVTKVFTDTVNMNQQMRFITLLHEPHVLVQDDLATDPARYLTITVEDDHVVERPLTCRVRVEWAQVIGDTPGGDFDIRIEPWNSNYETTDIWIDRPPYGVFDYTDTSGNPTGNGDRPRPLDLNRFIGRVHCDGVVDATNVRLTFYVVTPPGVGDNGNWGPLETKVIGTIPHDDSREGEVLWVPAVGEHTCLKIYAEPQAGEIIAGNNNWAQENVFEFEAPASSVPEPVIISVAVRNPLQERTFAKISLRNVPEGFIAQFPHAWVWLEPKQERRVELTVIPTHDVQYYLSTLAAAYERIPPQARIKVDGWIPNQYEEEWEPGIHPASGFMPMGGMLAQVKPKQRVNVSIREYTTAVAAPQPGIVRIIGVIDPKIGDETVTVDLKDPSDIHHIVEVKTDATGQFVADYNLTSDYLADTQAIGQQPSILTGIYVCQASIVNSPRVARADSNIIYIIR